MITKYPSYFTAIDRTPFTYCITHLPTGKRYYGSRYKKNCRPEDLWVTYFTSSKTVHDLIKEYGVEVFSYQIRKIFSSKEQCQLFETKLLQRLNLASRNDWLNQTNGGSSGFSFSNRSHSIESKDRIGNSNRGKLKGKHLSTEHRAKLSASLKGKPKSCTWTLSDETKRKMSASKRGQIPWNKSKNGYAIFSDDQKRKLSIDRLGEKNGFYGKTHTNSTKEKMRSRPKNICEHCDAIVDKGNYNRWHGNKCKRSIIYQVRNTSMANVECITN